MGHSHTKALFEPAILALVPIFLLDFTEPLTPVINQFQAYCSSEKALKEEYIYIYLFFIPVIPGSPEG